LFRELIFSCRPLTTCSPSVIFRISEAFSFCKLAFSRSNVFLAL